MSIVTAVIPTYNAAAFLRDTIQSIKAQTVPVAEILVVDDGSEDASKAVAAAAGARVLSTGGRFGPSKARNLGVQAATTSYIAFLDADDQWLPEHCETLLGLLQNEPKAAVAFARVRSFNDSGDIPPAPQSYPSDDGSFPRLLFDNPIAQSATMVDRARFLEVGGYREEMRFAEDYDLWLRLAERYPLLGASRRTCRYRIHSEQISRALLPMLHGGWEARMASRRRLRANGSYSRQMERCLKAALAHDVRSAWVEADPASLQLTYELSKTIAGAFALRQAIQLRRLLIPLRRLSRRVLSKHVTEEHRLTEKARSEIL